MQISMYAIPGLRDAELPIQTKSDMVLIKIRDTVSQYYKIPPEKIFRKCRKREVVVARQCMHSLARRFTNFSLEKIGEVFHNGRPMDHTSVRHSVQLIKDLCDTDPELRRQYDELISLMHGQKLNALKSEMDPVKSSRRSKTDSPVTVSEFQEITEKYANA